MFNAIEYSTKYLGLFANKKGEKIEFIEEVMVSIKFPDGVWDIIKEFMIEDIKIKLNKFIYTMNEASYKSHLCYKMSKYSECGLKFGFTNISQYVDLIKLQKKFNLNKKIIRIIVREKSAKQYMNQPNKFIKYQVPLIADKSDAGSYYKYFNMLRQGSYLTNYPMGDAFIVTKN